MRQHLDPPRQLLQLGCVRGSKEDEFRRVSHESAAWPALKKPGRLAWYQGENRGGAGPQYSRLMPNMIDDFRALSPGQAAVQPHFVKWVGDIAALDGDNNKASAILTMPKAYVSLRATYAA